MPSKKSRERRVLTLEEIRAREDKWDRHFLGLAQYMANMSRDPSTKVGSVITKTDHTVVSVGFNGFPRAMFDDPDLYDDRAAKLARIVHAEINAILNADRPVRGCTLYVSPLSPCSACAKLVAQAGIKRVVSIVPTGERAERWQDDLRLASQVFDECEVDQKFYHVDPSDLVKVIR